MQRLQSFLQSFFLATLAVAAPLIGSFSSQDINPQEFDVSVNVGSAGAGAGGQGLSNGSLPLGNISLSSTGGQTTNLMAAGSPWNKIRCYPVAPYRALKPLDCTNAMANFPREAKSALFSRASTNDRYRLPKPQVSGTCWIQVEVGILPEQGSWNQIRDEMFDIYTKCVTGGRWHGGGEVSFGTFGGFTVSIQNTIAPDLDSAGNSSFASSTINSNNISALATTHQLKPYSTAPDGIGNLKCSGPVAFDPSNRQNCLTAIEQLPTYVPGDPVPAEFSTTSPVDRFELPKVGLAGTCAASVDLTLLPVDEVHGWDTLRGVMQRLYHQCVVGQGRGGTVTVGALGGIELELQSMQRGAGSGGLSSSGGGSVVGTS